MASKIEIQKRIAFRKETLEEIYKAYTALVQGGVKSYRINNRELTRLDAPNLMDEIRKLESEIDELEALLADKRPRKAVAVVPHDW